MLQLVENIQLWGRELGFQQLGIADLKLEKHASHYEAWLQKNMHGDMGYMAEQRALRLDPARLQPGALRVISARMDYLVPGVDAVKLLDHPRKAYLSRYALGRDYHKLIRKRLATLGSRIQTWVENCEPAIGLDCRQRPFVDSAPVLERAFAEKAGLGWIAKNTMLINQDAGSWFFLGELITNLPLPLSEAKREKHCGSCTACLDICPTRAFAEEFVLDARKCISYLTIENRGVIPLQFRKAIGNRIFGCDDCQLICPWNKFTRYSAEEDFKPRHGLEDADLLTLFLWSEEEFLQRTEGSAIRRTGYECWLRNLAVGLGNAATTKSVVDALRLRLGFSPLVDEHIQWALQQHNAI